MNPLTTLTNWRRQRAAAPRRRDPLTSRQRLRVDADARRNTMGRLI